MLAFGFEKKHLNAGLLVWFAAAGRIWSAARWMESLRLGASWYTWLNETTEPGRFRKVVARPEQNMLNHLCAPNNASRRPAMMSAAPLRCFPIDQRMYSTGCSGKRGPSAAYHYNCGSHHHIYLQFLSSGNEFIQFIFPYLTEPEINELHYGLQLYITNI